jgi:alkanesulfonate monooxygenase SsuD/methylene tetrahydromethanopterin reductase-like flavin-dependent oxidoreductase (luciferase family)
MKLGVHLNSQHPADEDPRRRYAETVEQVRLMRQLGYDSIWSGEHHATDGFHYFPLMGLMQSLAAEAEGMFIGTNIVLLPFHNPVEIAELGAFLDVLSGGKFLFGVGLGYRQEEFDIFRVPIKERVSRTAEGVEIIRRLWTEDGVTHHGRHWQLEKVTIRPRPLQRPSPPILIAAQVEAAIQRAAKIGDGWCVAPLPKADEIVKEVATYKTARSAAGHRPAAHIVRLLEVACAADEETALRRAAPFLLSKYEAYASWGLPGLSFDKNATPEQQLKQLGASRFGVGTPEQVTEALLQQHRAGITHVAMRLSWPGMKQDDILSVIEVLGRKVFPEVRRRIAAEKS